MLIKVIVKNMKKVYDMTKGKIWTIILSFSLPLLGASLIQQLYNTADMIFVGNFVGKEATGAVVQVAYYLLVSLDFLQEFQ